MTTLPAHFTHLCTHSHFTLLGATPSVDQLVRKAAEDGLQSLALTDTNVLYGAVAFRRACQRENIRPIIGMTAAIELPSGEMVPDLLATWGHLTLLASSIAGYQSLCRLSSALQAGPNRIGRSEPALSWGELRDNSTGLICLSGDRTGWLERFLRAGNKAAATRTLGLLGGIFGDRCYVSIRPDLLTSTHAELGESLISLGARFGLCAAAVQPIYCLGHEEQVQLRIMAAIQHNCPIEEVGPAQLPAFADDRIAICWPNAADFAEAYAHRPDLLDITAEVALVCSQEDVLPSEHSEWAVNPRVPTMTDNRAASVSPLRALGVQGLEQHYGQMAAEAIGARLDLEISTVESVGYADLFLIVADIVRFAKSQGIAVSTRGSVANSLLAYCLGISTVDPIAHELIFERFLNPARRNPPDIDLDFCSRRRDEVFDYVRDTYGADRVALVSTMSTLQWRSAVRETAKAYRLAEEAVRQLLSVLPRGWHPDPRRRDVKTLDDMLAKVTDEKQKAVLRIAFELVGRPHHASIHPGGIVITPGPLTDVIPVEMAAKGFLITQYTHEDIEAVGLPKIDLLGIRALTVLTDTVELVQQSREAEFLLDEIPLDDPATGDLLSAAETIGVFQCESEGAQRTLRQLRARTVTDLAVAGAFFKPGPATGGMARAFVLRYRGEQAVSYLHPSLEPILGRTKGVLLFQEQVLRVVREIAGLSWEQADHIRRGMSKFKAREMQALGAEFINGCYRVPPQGPGLTQEQAHTLWEQVVAFAGYGFNQGHATAYADVSYRSAYLKARWPAEFMCARLANAGGFHHQAIYIAEARRLGIEVRPPHVNHSRSQFTLTYEVNDEHVHSRHPVLWMGLGQVRDLQRATIANIQSERDDKPFSSVDDILRRVSMHTKEMTALVQCGALDGLGSGRGAMLEHSGEIRRAGNTSQLSFGFAQLAAPVADNPRQCFDWELHLLGLPISVSPLDIVRRTREAVPLRRLPMRNGDSVVVDAFRLPGWTGGKGTFISDGDMFLTARITSANDNTPKLGSVWEPLRLQGRWVVDEWKGGWFQVDEVRALK